MKLYIKKTHLIRHVTVHFCPQAIESRQVCLNNSLSSGVYICKSIVNYLRHGNYICKSEVKYLTYEHRI